MAGSVDLGYSRDFAQRWILGRVLGRGAFGVVHECTAAAPAKAPVLTAAVKVLNKARLVSPDAVRREVAVMQRLGHHPHTVGLFDVCEDDANVYLVLSLCAGGELFSRVAAGGAYTESDAATVVRSVCAALAHAHLRGVCILDVKLDNMLFSNTPSGDDVLKVADFGLAQLCAPGEHGCSPPVGTAFYVAPELLLCHTFGPESDCWSLGVATYILLTGRAPFQGTGISSERAILARIALDPSPPDYQRPPWGQLSPHAHSFVQGLLQREPGARMTAAAALSHPWLRGEDESATSTMPLDASVLVGLRAFHQAGRMRRLALRALAATFTTEQLPAARDQFAVLHAEQPDALPRLRTALRSLSWGADGAATVESIVNDLDAGHEGRITWAEFAAGALRGRHLCRSEPEAWAVHVAAAFRALDEDADGFLTDEELSRRLGGDGAALRREADADGDGRVSLADFESLLRRSDSSRDFAAAMAAARARQR